VAEWSSLADVEQFRRLTRRHAVARAVDHPTVVLGSTQRETLLNPAAVGALPAEVVRRRGGGGAVLLLPGDHLWIDAWIPRDDPLWQADVSEAAAWVGAWWAAAFDELGVADCEVHRGKAVPGAHEPVCFSGRGPGEVFHQGAKLMGLSQWRSREGALFHSCAYTHWDATPLVDLFDLPEATRAAWREDLRGSAVGIEDLLGPGWGSGSGPGSAMAVLAEGLLSTFPNWGSAPPIAAG
jgi:lipoate---protein ligase